MIKILAAALMLIDHVGLVFFAQYPWLRMIGRLSMPLFAYSIASGYYFTARAGKFYKYLAQIAGFAVISQIPFMLMLRTVGIYHFSLSIGATWFLSLVVLRAVVGLFDSITASRPSSTLENVLWLAAGVAAVLLAQAVGMDYGVYGVLYPLACYPIVLAVRKRAEGRSAVIGENVVSANNGLEFDGADGRVVAGSGTAAIRRGGTLISQPMGYLLGTLGQIALNLFGVF
ncbi:MAG: conjugal transfer protein TraX, partial [Cellulomonadaceae bacterium]|nr:conjugal transfer protein TraX [Cellulomonadaceae bacterium]